MRRQASLLSLGLVGLLGLALVGCPPPVDYGRKCEFRKPQPGGQPQPVPRAVCAEQETKGDDLVSFGNTDCENLICLHTVAAPPAGWPASDVNCAGYCSACCLSNDDCYTGDDKRALFCRELLLDQAFLDGLRGDGGVLPSGVCSRYCSFK